MYLAYYDESGDDGYPEYSSELFVLSCTYLNHLDWKASHVQINDFRKQLAREYNFPFDLEFHTREFLLNKGPSRALSQDPNYRKEVLSLFCGLIGNLNCRIVNVVIDKSKIRRDDYPVLDTAFTYSIQRLETDLSPRDERFLIITDEGRVGKMVKTARKIQRYNPIPSKFDGTSYRKEIQYLVEDPLPKSSKESYFIQIADLVSYLVMLREGRALGLRDYPNRLKPVLSPDDIEACFELLRPSLNLKASSRHPLGVVCYPR